MHSCIYEGWVRHRRFQPVGHQFRYPIYLMYLDLDEIDQALGGRWLWSASRPAVARFRREDHLGDPQVPLSDAVRHLVKDCTGTCPAGPIRLLTHLRFFGYVINPVSFYYCFDEENAVSHLVAEVTNTPWGERHCYVMDASKLRSRQTGERVVKEFHVSPFMTMDFEYGWTVQTPEERLSIQIDSFRESNRYFDVTMQLQRREISTWNMASVLMRQPFMPQRVLIGIYWNALRLWMKKIPFVPHPGRVPLPTAGQRSDWASKPSPSRRQQPHP